MNELFTTKQVADALGVSVASLKRWCDSGLLPFIRTPGGHRRLPVNGVMQFIRRFGHEVVWPEVLGLPVALPRKNGSLGGMRLPMRDALESGDESEARRLALGLYLDGHAGHEVCDQVLAPAFALLGERWAHGELEIYEERRATEVCARVLAQLRAAMPEPPPTAPLAIGATLNGDPYTLPTLMVDLALHEAGWRAQSLGCGNPAGTLCRAMHDARPQLFWLSVSTFGSQEQFLSDYSRIYETAGLLGIAVMVGGRALTENVRARMRYAAFCDSLTHAVAFADALKAVGHDPRPRQPRETSER